MTTDESYYDIRADFWREHFQKADPYDRYLELSEPVYAGEFNAILRLFHDEQQVREAAFAAVCRAVERNVLTLQDAAASPELDTLMASSKGQTNRAINVFLVREIKAAIVKSYSKAGDKVVNMNNMAVDAALENIQEVAVPATADSNIEMTIGQWAGTPQTVQKTLGPIIDGLGEHLPISAMPADGTFPTATAMYEKRNIAIETPVWDEALCIQCGICSFVCPHATIRMKIYDEKELTGAPATFKSCAARGKEMDGKKFSLQVAVEDCTGCGACVYNCPAKSKENENHKAINMRPQPPLRETERTNFDFFLNLPETDPTLFNSATVKGSQLLPPLFEFSGACAGCGETPYAKLLTQLYGERMIIGNATGCSSIWGGSAPA